MTQTCNVCASQLDEPLYQSLENASITTMNKVIAGKTEVYFCDVCGHLQTTELPNLDQYYTSEYEINLQSDEDDQLYKVVEGKPVYRASHQANTLLRKVPLIAGMRVLDYGCAKAATLRQVFQARKNIVPLTFDVTDKYVAFWQEFVSESNWAAPKLRDEWNATIDVVLSFYALEHVKNLRQFLGNVNSLLVPGGIFYFIVPNAYDNFADFVVADHINHFSDSSLRRMLDCAGFQAIEVDARSHDAAFVVVARKTRQPHVSSPDPNMLATLRTQAADMANFWSTATRRIREFEATLSSGVRRAIYGAGFYGNFIASALESLDKVECFVDQNVHLNGRTILGKKIVPPDALDPDVKAVFVGLNPRVARKIIDDIPTWRGDDRGYLFL